MILGKVGSQRGVLGYFDVFCGGGIIWAGLSIFSPFG